MQKIFIIEDDRQIREELCIMLKRNQYEVEACTDFRAAADDALAARPSVVLLDLNLPYVDGHVVCREIRERSEVPIIVVTSRDSDLDELMAMNLGADDFITKPYSTQILLARIASVLRRSQGGGSGGESDGGGAAAGAGQDFRTTLRYQGLELDLAKAQLSYGDEVRELTKNELKILQVLMQNAERIVSRANLQNELWQSDQFVDDNTLTVNVNRLRTTLTNIGATDMLHTKRGLGYYLSADESKRQ